MDNIYLTECPRDAMQGIKEFIPTEEKISYLNKLLNVGFDCLDFGSFVSPKAIPQLRDTSEVLENLDLSNSKTKLLAIVANERGAIEAISKDKVSFLGFPLSVNETFQERNTNKSIAESINELVGISQKCEENGKKLVVYLSMAFGNPYGDYHSNEKVLEVYNQLNKLEALQRVMLSDTIGSSSPETIESLISTFAENNIDLSNIGVHLHSNPITAADKIKSAYNAGIRIFDSAMLGIGGCPMAKDELVGNISTETIVDTLNKSLNLNNNEYQESLEAARIFFN